MANIQSAKKRVRQEIKRRAVNLSRKTALKTVVKKALAAIETGNVDESQKLFKVVQSQFSRAKSKRVVHHKTASRKISRLSKKIVSLIKTDTNH